MGGSSRCKSRTLLTTRAASTLHGVVMPLLLLSLFTLNPLCVTKSCKQSVMYASIDLQKSSNMSIEANEEDEKWTFGESDALNPIVDLVLKTNSREDTNTRNAGSLNEVRFFRQKSSVWLFWLPRPEDLDDDNEPNSDDDMDDANDSLPVLLV
mmetsp:Transcript_8409/g.20783  ORF Transcript_8409/g.20783 Transcript_8409/m.20783 type:complete len:153 (-) Transcript_8409:33-491(-)